MDKYEYNVKLEQIKKLIRKKDYATAARIADTIDWYKVKNNQTIVLIADVYEASGRYEQARENLKLAYDRSGLGRQIAYKLVKVCIKCGDIEEAEEFYDDFVSAAPRDICKYLLQYELAKAKGESLDKQIAILEQYLEEDMDDRWAYELAKLYHKSGQRDKCIEQCDTVMLWFSDGRYVDKAMDLKMVYTPLTKSQQQRYEARWRQKSAQNNIKIEEIKVKEIDVNNKYNTQNIQKVLKESMEEIYAKEGKKLDEADEVFKPHVEEETAAAYEDTAQKAEDYLSQMALNAMVYSDEPVSDDTKVFVTTRSKQGLGDTKVFRPYRHAVPEQISFEAAAQEEESQEQPHIVEETTITREEKQEELEEDVAAEESHEEEELREAFEETTAEEEKTEEPEEEAEEELEEELEEESGEEYEVEEAEEELEEELEEESGEEYEVEESEEEPEEEQIEEQIEGQMSLEDFFTESGEYQIPVEEKQEEEEEEEQKEEEKTLEMIDVNEPTEEREEIDPFVTTTNLQIPIEKIRKDSRRNHQKEEEDEVHQEQLSNEEIKEIIKDFIGKYSGVQNLDKQMLQTLQNVIVDDNCNVFIVGDAKSGKTSIGIDLIKVVNKIKRNNNRRIAKISADKLRGKDIGMYFQRLEGSDLYIENISLMDDDSLDSLLEAMDQDMDARIVVIEDEKINAEHFLEQHLEIRNYFANCIVVRQNKIKDWVEVAREYAESKGYAIDEIGLLALHAKIDQLYGLTLVIQRNHVERIIDDAIRRAEKGGIFRKIFGKKRDKELTEEHFN